MNSVAEKLPNGYAMPKKEKFTFLSGSLIGHLSNRLAAADQSKVSLLVVCFRLVLGRRRRLGEPKAGGSERSILA